ncbi:type VII secretion system-associated protein [Saccharothrix syringae]|uniref:type VII secretion system-associated protein n=1 Tax=Saccharothrix syringae TaxID=103733 RepID=UPI0007C4D84A|nr:type VII secretion system-associated protein [Saccharothrix syringae]
MVAADADTENWFLLMDPSWQPESEDDPPPLEAVVGLWPVEPEGGVGRFRANPSYVPSDPQSPTDPLDAVIRLLMKGEAEADQLQLLLRDSLFDIAMNGDGRPLVMRSPDDVPCVAVTTSEVHRRRVASPEWQRIDLDDLVVFLGDEVDVLFNPGGPASVRLLGDFMRRTHAMSEEEVAAAYERFRDGRTLEVVPWDVPPVSGGGTADEEAPGALAEVVVDGPAGAVPVDVPTGAVPVEGPTGAVPVEGADEQDRTARS